VCEAQELAYDYQAGLDDNLLYVDDDPENWIAYNYSGMSVERTRQPHTWPEFHDLLDITRITSAL